MEPNCPCVSAISPVEFTDAIGAFYELRTKCAALRATIPDDILPRHRAFTATELDDANHVSVPFLAYRRGRLFSDFTSVLHGFVVDAAGVRPSVQPQYAKDLRETWMFERDSSARFVASRRYVSRLAELDFARWLETNGWTLDGMELYRPGNPDIEATDTHGTVGAFEVKFLAQREVVFELNRAAFAQSSFGYLGVYSPVDYLLYRVYDAARQLSRASARRIAVAIVSDYEISYKIPLSENWIDWKNPKFLRRDSEIESFLTREHAANPNLGVDVQTAIRSLHEVWIMKYTPAGMERAQRYVLSE